jgi:hypothetical protein
LGFLGTLALTFQLHGAIGVPGLARIRTGVTAMNLTLRFDRESQKLISGMRQDGGFETDEQMVLFALKILRTLQVQAKEGYKEVVVQNSMEGRQRLLDGISVLDPDLEGVAVPSH